MMYLALAWRNLWRNHRRTLITLTSIAFAVVLAQWLGAMTRGAHNQMIDNVSRFHTGFIQVQDTRFEAEPSLDNALLYDASLADTLATAHPDIQFLVPRIETFMLAAGEQQTRGAMVLGIDPEQEHRLNRLRDRVVEGRLVASDEQAVAITQGLARRLDLAVGDSLVLLGQGRFGMSASGRYPIVGLISHPLRDMDNQTVYMPLSEAQWLLSADEHVTALLVTPESVRTIDDIATRLRQVLADQPLRVQTWSDMMPELRQAIQFDAAQQYLMVGVLYMVIGFGLFGTVLMMTLERTREFGVLLSIGMRRHQLAAVLLIETLLLSLLGVLAGTLVGYPLVYWFYRNPIELGGDMAEVIAEMGMGMEAVLTFSMDPDIFWLQALIIFALAFVICLYPLVRVARLNCLDATRSGG